MLIVMLFLFCFSKRERERESTLQYSKNKQKNTKKMLLKMNIVQLLLLMFGASDVVGKLIRDFLHTFHNNIYLFSAYWIDSSHIYFGIQNEVVD